MKKSRFSEDQMVAILAEGESKPIPDVCRSHNISTGTFYAWKVRFSGLSKVELKHRRTLEQENVRLRKLLAEAIIDKDILKEAVGRLERLGKR